MAFSLDRAALGGLKLIFRDAAQQGYQTGFIQEYDPKCDCFIVCNSISNQYCAIQFRQFVVDQVEGQLVLKVPLCVHQALPARYQAVGDVLPPPQDECTAGAGTSSSASSGSATPQLSTALSQQLSGLIGRCFSHTDDGFEVASPEQQQAAATSLGMQQLPQQQQQQRQQPIQLKRRSRPSTDSNPDEGGYWGSPVKHDGIASQAAASFGSADPAGGTAALQQQPHGSVAAPAGLQPMAAAAAAAAQAGSFSSFQEISRMISHSQDNSPLARPGSIKTSVPPGVAARLLDEQGSWGTPQENSPWGTPRDQPSNAGDTPTSSSSHGEHPGQHHSHHSGQALHKLMFGGGEQLLHSRVEATGQQVDPQQARQQQPQQHEASSFAAASAAAEALGAAAKAAADTAEPMAVGGPTLEPAGLVAAAVAAVDAAASAEADGCADMDFTIPTAMDVQPRPHSRGSSRIREMYRVGSSNNTAGMVVDAPQPLSTRHSSMLRSPGRSLPAPSDPGHMGMHSAFDHAANMSAAAVSASAGGAGVFEQRRTASNISPGLGSFGGSHAASRRMSRNTSSRLNADQDWALLGPEAQALQQQQLGAMQQLPHQRVSLGQVLHAPAVNSRRASRTLSGRLALDQDLAAVLMEQLDDAEPDVLSRPLAPAAPGLDTIVSRRQSTSNGRGTPDSDGFGFSEFEGLEPLVPPEEAAAAALTEAAAAAAAAAATATEAALGEGLSGGGAGAHHHRAHRRSARSLGVTPALSASQRSSMRLSDQDPGHHGLAALPTTTAAAVAAAAAARAHANAAAGARLAGYATSGTPEPVAEEGTGLEEAAAAAAGANGSNVPVFVSGTAAVLSRAGSRAAAGSPRQSNTGVSSARSASGSLGDSRRSSKRSIPSIFQAAAAVAAAAEAATAAAVGFALGGRDRASSEQQVAMQADEGQQAAAQCPTVPEQQQGESPLAASSFLRQRLGGGESGLGSSFGSVDSFTCPPLMSLAGSVTATGGSGSGGPSGAGAAAPGSGSGAMADGSSHGSQLSDAPGAAAAQAAADIEMDLDTPMADAAGAVNAADMIPLPGAAVEAAGAMAMAAAAAGAAAGDGAHGVDGMYSGSPAAAAANNFDSFMAGTDSPCAASALLRKQLNGGSGSEWGSGTLLSSQLQLGTSGIDSPTGSAVFRLGGNSPYPQDAVDSAAGGTTPNLAPGELSAALESLAMQSGCSTGAKTGGKGASRMAREAAAAAAGMGGGFGGSNGGPVGAAALLIGTRVEGLEVSKGPAVAGLSEITPAGDDDIDEPMEGRISAKWCPSDSGSAQGGAATDGRAVFFRLAGGRAPGEQKTVTALTAAPGADEQGLGEQQQQWQQRRDSSSGGGAAVSKVLGKILTGKVPLLPRPVEQPAAAEAQPACTAVGPATNTAAAAAITASARSSDASSSSGVAPPSYAESVGADADDERSPFAAGNTTRRVWPSRYAAAGMGAAALAGPLSPPPLAAGAAAGTAAVGSGDAYPVRQGADLGMAPAAPSAAAAGVSTTQQQQQQWQQEAAAEGDDDESDVCEMRQPSTGLVRRTPHAYRTPSQSLPAGLRPNIEGLGVIGAASFHYGDESCGQQLLMMRGPAASTGSSAAVLQARSQVGRVVLHTFITLCPQWFDSLALVVLGPQLAGALLPANMPAQQQLRRLFGVFVLGHVLWLLGCFLWPWRAAKLGKQGLLLWTLGLPALCTALAGCMPSYAEGGMAAMWVITVLRLLQGAGTSNTASAALVYLSEHAPRCPHLHASLVPASMAAGALGASALALLLSWLMPAAVLGASGWRVVLVVSLLGNAVAGWLRGWVLQEPEGQMHVAELVDRSNIHMGRVLRTCAPQLLLAVLLQAFAVSGLFLLTAWLPSHLMQLAGMAPATALLCHTMNMAVLTGSMLLGGLLADEWEPAPVLLATCVTAVAFGWPAWLLFSMGVAEVTWFAQCILCLLVGLHWGALSELLLDLFPPGVRASALTIAHTLAMVTLGSTAPLMALGVVSTTGSPAAPALVSIIMAAPTAAVVVWQAWQAAARGRY